MTIATTLPQAVSLGVKRALRTGIRQQVQLCRCGMGRHFRVLPVDRVPEGLLA